MPVTAVSDLTMSIMSNATRVSNQGVQQQISGAILKQILDQQKAAGDSLVQLIKSGSLTGTGKLIDASA